MSGVVTVEILRISSQTNPPSTQLEYRVSNETHAPIWLVEDGWLIWRQKGRAIELCYARGTMQPGSHVFGYFPPSVVQVKAGESVSHVIDLLWPQALDRLWNNTNIAAPPPGRYEVSVRIGYGETAEPDPPDLNESVEAPVLRWQKEAVSKAISFDVPPYRDLNEEAD